MDLDGFLKLNDAQIKTADAQADNAVKLTQAEINWAQADHQKLENLRLLLNIQWDSEAHHHLLRMRTEALMRARVLRNEADKLRRNLGHVTWLLAGGGDWEQIRDGWLALAYLRDHGGSEATIKAAAVRPDETSYHADAWSHSTHAAEEYKERHDAGALLQWAQKHTYFPAFDGPAWTWLANTIQALDAAAGEEAKRLEARLVAAQKDARELEDRGWDRLKEEPKS